MSLLISGTSSRSDTARVDVAPGFLGLVGTCGARVQMSLLTAASFAFRRGGRVSRSDVLAHGDVLSGRSIRSGLDGQMSLLATVVTSCGRRRVASHVGSDVLAHRVVLSAQSIRARLAAQMSLLFMINSSFASSRAGRFSRSDVLAHRDVLSGRSVQSRWDGQMSLLATVLTSRGRRSGSGSNQMSLLRIWGTSCPGDRFGRFGSSRRGSDVLAHLGLLSRWGVTFRRLCQMSLLCTPLSARPAPTAVVSGRSDQMSLLRMAGTSFRGVAEPVSHRIERRHPR
jgi:hypothetical protein